MRFKAEQIQGEGYPNQLQPPRPNLTSKQKKTEMN